MKMKNVTLKGIRRVGLARWKGREWWNGKKVHIWTDEHCGWWRQKAQGYTENLDEAGVYDFADAYKRTKHCGPEKRIIYYVSSRVS